MNKWIISPGLAATGLCFAISLSCIDAAAQQGVNLADNLYGIATPGTPVTGGGLDGFDDAYAADQLGPSLTWAGETFTFGMPGPGSAVTSRVIAAPAGRYISLSLLATGVHGNQPNQTFVVTYTDGSTATFVQSLSDWHTPQHYPGESIAKTTNYRIRPNGSKQFGVFDVYGYTLGLDGSKAVQSVTLPNNRNVIVLALDVTQVADAFTASPVSLAPVDNLYGIGEPGTSVTGGGADGLGNAFAGDLLEPSLSWAGQTFTFGSPGPGSAVTSQVIPLPPHQYINLSLLGAGVDGNHANQTFTVTYSDGTTTHFVRSLSDWHTPQHYPGESIALVMPYNITNNGGPQLNSFNVYGYTLDLDTGKTAVSLTLPANRRVVVLAVDVTPAAPGAISTSVPLTATDNLYAIANPGTTVTAGGVDGSGDAYAADLLGSSLTWSGDTFTFGLAGPASGVTNKIVALPSGHYESLSLLAAGVAGQQINQEFVVTYADGSSSSFTQSLSDWHNPQHYRGESIAKTTNYDILRNGSKHFIASIVYGYTFPLDSTKTVRTVALPNNRDVVVLALDLNTAPTAAEPNLSLPGGTYVGQQHISLGDSTPGAVIYYTLDGTTPTSASARYQGPFDLFASFFPVNYTVQAIALANGFTSSLVANANYTITPLTAAAPTFSPDPGLYGSPWLVAVPPPFPPLLLQLADGTAGATILYSINGPLSPPTFPATVYSGPFALTEGSINSVNALASALGFVPSPIVSATYSIPVFPSDATFPGGGNFLFNELQDSCLYYRAIGAETTAASSGTCQLNTDGKSFKNGITFKQWLDERFSPLQMQSGGLAAQAMFVNMMDLNFTRDHHAVWNGQSGANTQSAAYVCNFPGPDFYHDAPAHIRTDLPAVDAAIQDARNNKNPLPCVAIDYGVVPGVNSGNPFMRFLVFDHLPNSHDGGNLLAAVDLDLRGGKQVPNACSACHGIPLFANLPGSGPQAHTGGSYIPFDEPNLQFSFAPGVAIEDQEPEIRNLNLIVLKGQNTPPGSGLDHLIHGWYDDANGSLMHPTQKFYVPSGILSSSLDDLSAYFIYAGHCRSCHVSNGVQLLDVIGNDNFPPEQPGPLLTVFSSSGLCSPRPTAPPSFALMPNARTTFDRFWTTHVGPSASPGNEETDHATFMQRYLHAISCSVPSYDPYPNQIP